MSLQHLTEIERGINLNLKIGCNSLESTTIKTESIEAVTYIGLPNASTLAIGSIVVGNYSLGSGAGLFLLTNSIRTDTNYNNGNIVRLNGTFNMSSIATLPPVNGVSTIDVLVSIPDTIIYPIGIVDLLSGHVSGEINIGGVPAVYTSIVRKSGHSTLHIVISVVGNLSAGTTPASFTWSVTYITN